MRFTFYAQGTGFWSGTVVECDDLEQARLNVLPEGDWIAVECPADPHSKRLVDGALVDVADIDLPAAPPALMRRLAVQAQIESLERQQPRALRELALGMEGALERLAAIEAAIQQKRSELA